MIQEHNRDNKLGTLGLTVFYISSIVGVGILIVPGIAYQIAGPASLIAWLLLTIFSFPLAFIFSKISMKYPHNGGIVYFIRIRLGEAIGQSAGLLLTITMIVGNPIMGIASARYFLHMLDIDVSSGNVIAFGFGFMLLSVLFNLLNLNLSSRIQTLMLVLLITGLLCLIFFSIPHYRADAVTPFMPNGWTSVGMSMVVCLYSFLGWENVSTIAEEVKNPVRSYKRAVIIAVLTVGFLYLALSLSIVMAVPYTSGIEDEMAVMKLLTVISSPNASFIMNMGAILLMVLCTNAWVLSASRFVASLGKDGVIPKFVGKVTKRSSIPVYSLLFLLLFYGLVLLLLFLLDGSEKELMLFANSSFLIIYLITFVSSYKHFGSKIVNIMSIAVFLFCFVSLYFVGWMVVFPTVFLFISFFYLRRRLSHAKQNI